MTDENPYRFTGDADEATALRETTPDASLGAYRRPYEPPVLTPREVRRLVFDRARFAVAFLIAAGWNLFAAYFLPGPPRIIERIDVDPQILRDLLWVSRALLFCVAAALAYRTQRDAARSRLAAFVLSALLFVPFLRYLVAFFLLQDSRLALFRHGIRTTYLRTEPGALPGPGAP